jgi:hypothetical protein
METLKSTLGTLAIEFNIEIRSIFDNLAEI